MQSLRELYRIGTGPSSSNTIVPRNAAITFLKKNSNAQKFVITLFGSLAATGKGHLTDKTIHEIFLNHQHEILWQPEINLPQHPNGMPFESFDENSKIISSWKVYSIGGGALGEDGKEINELQSVYNFRTMTEILFYCEKNGKAFWEYVEEIVKERIFGVSLKRLGMLCIYLYNAVLILRE